MPLTELRNDIIHRHNTGHSQSPREIHHTLHDYPTFICLQLIKCRITKNLIVYYAKTE